MDEYAAINYKEVKILLEIGDNNSFHPVSNLVKPIPYLPNYVEGVANLDGTISVVIDLAVFLGVNYSALTTHIVFLQVKHSEGDFVLKIPLPRIINEQITFKALSVKDRLTRQIPSARYFVVGTDTYLVLVIDDLVDFMSRELSDILFNAWINVNPKWDTEIYRNLVPNQSVSSISTSMGQRDRVSFSNDLVDENIIAFDVGEFSFLIEEKDVIDILTDTFNITPLPNTLDWMRGVVNYQNETLMSVDLNLLFDIYSPMSHDLDIVIAGDEGYFVVNTRNVRSVPYYTLSKTYVNDYEDENIPICNILVSDQNKVFYKINPYALEKMIQFRQKSSTSWEDWIAFFRREKHNYEDTDSYLMGELQSLNTLTAFVGGQQLVVSHDDIATLQSNDNYKYFEGFRFIEFEGEWIPSIDLNSYLNQPSGDLRYGTVVKVGDQKMEIKSEDAVLSYIKGNLIDNDKLKLLAPSSDQSGVSNFVSTQIGFGFDLNIETLIRVVGEVKNDKGKSLNEATKEINQKFAIPEVKEEIISDYIMGMWDENSDVFLFAELQNEENNRFAYTIDNIRSFFYKVPEDVKEDNIIPWEYETRDDRYFYVKVTKDDDKEVTYQIPSSSYLRAVTHDSIKKDKEGEFISLSQERIPILSFK